MDDSTFTLRTMAAAVVFAALTLFTLPDLHATGTTEDAPLRFGSLPAISALPIIYAEERGLFDDAGVDVEIVPFNSPTERNVALQTGQIDAFVGDVMTAVTFREGGFPVVITSDINEDFKLLAAPQSGVTSVSGLDGREVSLVPNFVLEYIMDVIARENGIAYEVIVIPSISARFEALLSGQIDAVLFTEPQASLLEAAGATIIASSREYGIKAGAMIFREAYVETAGVSIGAFYRAYDRAVNALNGTDLSEHAELLAAYGFPPDVAARVGGTVELTAAAPIPRETIGSVIAWMESKGTQVGVEPAEIVQFGFLP
ncbi:MAG: ABC transporter substrate-binding protein [Spirochaetota bacterium]